MTPHRGANRKESSMRITKIIYQPIEVRTGLRIEQASILANAFLDLDSGLTMEAGTRWYANGKLPDRFFRGQSISGYTVELYGPDSGEELNCFAVDFGEAGSDKRALEFIQEMLKAGLESAEMQFELSTVLDSSFFRWNGIKGEWDLVKVRDALEASIASDKEAEAQLSANQQEFYTQAEQGLEEFYAQEALDRDIETETQEA